MIQEAATRTVVAATKLAIPRSRRPLVPRPELSARLDSDYRLALVSAPAGYGKTATLASWATQHSDRLAWLSCDTSDGEPVRFMTSLLASISARWPGVADDAFVLLERDASNTRDSAVAVANDLGSIDERGVIVVDDLHLAAPPSAVLTSFIDALPANFRLVAGTRSDPPLSLARLRLRGELVELRGSDLRFAPAEMSDFFALHEVPLTSDELHRLHALTEGWAAGAQLAAIALQRGVSRDRFLEAFATTDRAIGDFLVSEVLDNLPEELVEFLLATSVLETFDTELCVAVTGTDEAALLLDRLIAANLFLVPLDDAGRWYRYHHLFRAFLRARLTLLGQAKRRAVHDRALAALEVRGDLTGALQQAMAMPDVERAGQIVRIAVDRSMSMSDSPEVTAEAVRLWLREFGVSFIETDPAWVVQFVIGLISLTGAEDAPMWLDRVRHAHPDAHGELAATIEGGWAEHHQHRGQPLAALPHLYAALEAADGIPANRGLLPLLPPSLARAQIQAGTLDAARSTLEQALASPGGSPIADEVRNPALAAYVAAADGDLSRATDLATAAVEAADRLGLGFAEPGRVFAGLALVDVHVERNQREAALRMLADVKRASTAGHRATLESMVLLVGARAARMLGDGDAADALLTQTRLCFTDADSAAKAVFDEEAAEQALRFHAAIAPSLVAALDEERPRSRMLKARLALLDHDDRAAEAILDALPPPTTPRQRVERAVLRALSERDRGAERANLHLHEALEAGQPEWMIQSIVDHGTDIAKLLAAFTPDAAHEAYLHALITAADHVIHPATTAETAQTLAEPLSAREVTVLRYLCSRLTYQEIAAALYVSLNTLKSHVKSVYRKLEVASRADAVEVGRRLGVI